MPVLDGNFEAFVTNLGKYNEGMLVGEWVKLPTTEEKMKSPNSRVEFSLSPLASSTLSSSSSSCTLSHTSSFSFQSKPTFLALS